MIQLFKLTALTLSVTPDCSLNFTNVEYYFQAFLAFSRIACQSFRSTLPLKLLFGNGIHHTPRVRAMTAVKKVKNMKKNDKFIHFLCVYRTHRLCCMQIKNKKSLIKLLKNCV